MHSTHIYQGLDVIIFSPLKRYWAEERDIAECEHGQKVTKSNFLSIYARAHQRALSPDNIKSAFQKTDVHPFDPLVITSDMLALSRETSLQYNALLPFETPIRVIVVDCLGSGPGPRGPGSGPDLLRFSFIVPLQLSFSL